MRISDVAKDFGVPNKQIMNILAEYTSTPKSPAKVLNIDELNIIFDAITHANQVDDIEKALNIGWTAEEAQAAEEMQAAEEKAAEEKTAEETKSASAKAKAQAEGKPQSAKKPDRAEHVADAKAAEKRQPSQPARKPVRRYVDTRGATVDMSKYDDRIDVLVPDKAAKFDGTRQKIKKAPDRRNQSFGQKRRIEEQEKLRKLQMEVQKKSVLKVSIPDEISVGELAVRLKKTGVEVIKQLMKLGVMASLSDTVDFDTASLVAMEYGAKIEHEVHLTIEERLIDDHADAEEDLVPRDPVVVVMGHVDHGKTSLLDAIRKTNVAEGEAGGITQHIGAYQVEINDRMITFLDTPGHEAFTAMRARGASVTDVVILVVAADDGIMPQTIEAINHARAANVPIVVAINKMDKPEADPERIMRQLTEHNLLPEEWGGDTIVSKISAVTGTGIPSLLEMVLLVADMRELKANPNRPAQGTVIEAKLDKGRGAVATLLVQNGTLRTGDLVIAGKSVGRIRAMTNDKGMKIDSAGLSMPVEIIGLDEVPAAGDKFHVITDERMARELAQERKQKEREKMTSTVHAMTLTDLYAQIQEGSVKELNIILKSDVQGSVEALKKSLEELSNDEVRVRIIHGGVGAINENDVMLASASNAIIIGFNVRPDANARNSAEQKGIDMRLHRIIYECVDEVKAAIKGMLTPKFKEEILGTAEIRQVFKITGFGTVAGCMVKSGKVQRNAKVRVVRDGVVVHEGDIASLKRFKDDAREVAAGYECGIGIDKFGDVKVGDIIENYIMVQL